MKRDFLNAELTAVWSLTKALEAHRNLFQVCNAFNNMIIIASIRKKKFWGLVLEVHALRFCHKKKDTIEPPELRVVIKLYTTIFELRFGRAEIDGSLQLGYILSRLTLAVNDTSSTIQIFSKIMLMLLIKLYLSECVTIMDELHYHTDDSEDLDAKVEYYACGLLFHAETGYNCIPMKTIEKYYKGEIVLKPTPTQRRFLVLLRSWFCRTGQWERATIVTKQLSGITPRVNMADRTFNMGLCLMLLYEIEYYLMKLVYMKNKRNILNLPRTKAIITTYFEYLESRMDMIPVIKCRTYTLRAYEAVINDNERKMKRYARKTRKHAEAQENVLYVRLIDFLEAFWLNQLPEGDAEMWFKHSEPDNYMEYNQLNHGDNIMCFPFEPPLYY